MRLKLLFYTALSISATILAGALPMAEANTGAQRHDPGKLEAWLMPGVATGKLDWNVAHPSGSPDVLSELIFDNIRTLTLEAGARYQFTDAPLRNLQLRVAGRTGLVQDGDEHDRDWNGNNRTQLYSYSRAHIKSNRVDQAQAAVGYTWVSAEPVSLTAYLGYEWNRQHLRITHGRQLLDTEHPSQNDTPIVGLHNRYNADWHSGWLGLEAIWEPLHKHQVGATVQYHQLWYEAEATWNLRPDFAQPNSFDHTASHGQGARVQLQYRTEFTPDLGFVLQLSWERFEIDQGIDRVHFVSPEATVKSPLNEVSWQQYALSTGLVWQF